MAAFISTEIPQDVRLLHKKVAECIDVINALMNMTVTVEGRIRMTGRLEMREGGCILKIEERSEVGSLGT